MTDIDIRSLDPARVVEIDLASPALRNDWVNVMAEWAIRPPFYAVWGGTVQVICPRHRDALEVYADRDRFTAEVPKLPGHERFDKFMGIQTVAQLDGERHDRLRRLLNPAFGPTATARFEPYIVSIIAEMLDGVLDEKGEFDAMTDFCDSLMVRIMLDGMFKLDDEQKRVFNRMRKAVPLATTIVPGGTYPAEYVEAFAEAKETILALIADRRAKPGDDHISQLIAARDEGDALTDIELYDQIFTLCIAALESTASAMGGVILSLWRHPDQLQKVRDDRTLIPDAIEECLRYHGVGLFTFPRWARYDTEVGGTPILKGMVVRPAPQAASFDPVMYPDPLRFDVLRKPEHVLAFAWGPHYCLGQRLARIVLRHGLEQMLLRFPTLRLAVPNFSPSYHGQVGMLVTDSIPMRVDVDGMTSHG